MRSVPVLPLLALIPLAACELPYPWEHTGSGDDISPPDRPTTNTCGFWEGEGSVPCSNPGASCSIETWEHGCDCSCGNDGWWSCYEETIGSRCPQGAPKDAAIPDSVDAIMPDAAPCSPVEAEAIGSHAGWWEVYGSLSNNMGLSAETDNQTVSFNFTGTTLAVTHERGPSIGTFTVSIDGATPVAINGYKPNDWDFVTTPLASGLANTTHSVTVHCVTATCTLDVFPVTCN